MPQLQVTFRAGTKAQYDALQTKDEGCLYFLTDKNMIYRGNVNVTSRYLIGSIPAGSAAEGLNGIRLTDQATGQVYDIPLYSSVSGWLENNLALRFDKNIITSNEDLLHAIGATVSDPASGTVNAGMVFRYENREVAKGLLNPGQFAKPDYLVVNNHDLVVALYTIKNGLFFNPREDNHSVGAEWIENHQVFTVIPTDLVDLVTASTTLDNNKVILGAGGNIVKAMPFAGANKVLRTNSENNGVEWVTPETVENVVYWEDIDEQ